MAGRPLRPATRRSLGRPSPHQQADRPRAHPQPKKLSTTTHAGRSEYSVLATVSDGYPKVKGRLLTCYSPVRRSSTPEGAFPLDLHVLSTPPAFVLSQDQTLREEVFVPKDETFVTLSLCSKSVLPKENPTGFSFSTRPQAIWPRRKRTLLSFQRPVPRSGGGVKKPPTRARGLQSL